MPSRSARFAALPSGVSRARAFLRAGGTRRNKMGEAQKKNGTNRNSMGAVKNKINSNNRRNIKRRPPVKGETVGHLRTLNRMRTMAGQSKLGQKLDDARTSKRVVPNLERFARLSRNSKRKVDVAGLDVKGGAARKARRYREYRKKH